ncbi:hypothetical protein KIPB_006216, partial [Kipferlia bialata]|eukprot:g6216.t1
MPSGPVLYSSPALVIDAEFEAGNIGSVKRVGDTTYDLNIRPDPGSASSRLWFYFRVTNVVPKSALYVFNMLGFSKNRTSFSVGMTPIVRSSSKPKWEKIPTDQCFNYSSSRHRSQTSRPILSIVFRFDKKEDEYFFAFTYPYTHSMLQRYLSRLMQSSLTCVHRESLCHTLERRRVDMLLLSKGVKNSIPSRRDREREKDREREREKESARDTEKMMEEARSRERERAVREREKEGLHSSRRSSISALPPPLPLTPVLVRSAHSLASLSSARTAAQRRPHPIFMTTDGTGRPVPKRLVLVTARVHPGETPAAFVSHGLLEWLISPRPRAQALLERAVVVLVPMINPDGVHAGHYRCNSAGIDVNRRYDRPSTIQTPVAYHLSALVKQLGTGSLGHMDYLFDRMDALLREIGPLSHRVDREREREREKDAERRENRSSSRGGSRQDSDTESGVWGVGPHQNSLPSVNIGEPVLDERIKHIRDALRGCPLDLVVDLHSHSALEGGFVYVNPDNPERPSAEGERDAYRAAGLGDHGEPDSNNNRFQQELLFPRLLQNRCHVFQDSYQAPREVERDGGVSVGVSVG